MQNEKKCERFRHWCMSHTTLPYKLLALCTIINQNAVFLIFTHKLGKSSQLKLITTPF